MSYVILGLQEGIYSSRSLLRCIWWCLLTPLSDLLVRHERLSHNDGDSGRNAEGHTSGGQTALRPGRQGRHKRVTTRNTAPEPTPLSAASDGRQQTPFPNSAATMHTGLSHNHDSQLAAPTTDSEQATLPDVLTSDNTQNIHNNTSMDNSELAGFAQQPGEYTPFDGGMTSNLEFDGLVDNLAAFLDNGPLASHHFFSSLISAEQPIPFFTPESTTQQPLDFVPEQGNPDLHHQGQKSIERDGRGGRTSERTGQ